jgi:ankyrin repeat protein
MLDREDVLLPATLEDMYRNLGNGRDKLKFDDITSLLCHVCNDLCDVYIIIDALDEMDVLAHRRQVISLMKSLADASAKILITSRPHLGDIRRSFSLCATLEITGDECDIRAYVKHRVETNDELAELVDDELIQEVVQKVTIQAAGMYDSQLLCVMLSLFIPHLTDYRFLLAVLQCDSLYQLCRVAEVKRALNVLPNGLEEAYESFMQRISLQPRELKSLAMATLSWTFHSRRPLRASELLHALAVDSYDMCYKVDNLPSKSLMIRSCAGLVVLDPENDVVRFSHYSVHEYFKATSQQWFPHVKFELAKTCLAYLRLEELHIERYLSSEDLGEDTKSYPFLNYAAHYWGYHVKEGYRIQLDKYIMEILQDSSKATLIARILDNDDVRSKRKPYMFPCGNISLQLSSRFGTLEIVNLLLQEGHEVSGVDSIGRTALHWAARGGFGQVVNLLLQFGADHDAPTIDGRTPLHWAAKHGHAEVVRELIRHGANPAAQTSDGRTPLHWASSRGHETVSKILLLDANVNAQTMSYNGWTALHWAACSGNRAIVGPLLETRLECFKASHDGISLNGGNSKGHEAVTSLAVMFGYAISFQATYQIAEFCYTGMTHRWIRVTQNSPLWTWRRTCWSSSQPSETLLL